MSETYEVVGFIVGKIFQENINVSIQRDRAWIQCVVVGKSHRNQEIGKALLAHAEAQFQAAGMKEVLLGSDMYHYFPGIPDEQVSAGRFFNKHGYVFNGQEFDVYRKYEGVEGNSLPEVNDVSFSLLEADEKAALLDFLKRCFPGRSEYEAIHYFEKGGTGREFAIIKKAGKLIGFCRTNDASSPFITQNVYWAPLFTEALGGIGPLCVDAAERGHGYGLAIVQAGIAFLRQRGIKHIVIDWTGLVDFYGKLGYEIWKTYNLYSKNIE